MNNGNNMDMAKLMSILSKMDKKDLKDCINTERILKIEIYIIRWKSF